jgi:hypothetical protein
MRMWDYFRDVNRDMGTHYRYIMRMDEVIFFHSPIEYDLFGFMARRDYYYAYRICFVRNRMPSNKSSITTRLKYECDWVWIGRRIDNSMVDIVVSITIGSSVH